jgi:hypothetical protein
MGVDLGWIWGEESESDIIFKIWPKARPVIDLRRPKIDFFTKYFQTKAMMAQKGQTNEKIGIPKKYPRSHIL